MGRRASSGAMAAPSGLIPPVVSKAAGIRRFPQTNPVPPIAPFRKARRECDIFSDLVERLHPRGPGTFKSTIPSPPTLFRRGSSGSSAVCRRPTPPRRACGPYGLSLLPPVPAGRDVPKVSRFSCLKFRGVPGVYDYAGPVGILAFAHPFHAAFRLAKDVCALIARFRSSIPRPPIPLFMLHCASHDAQRKTRGRVDRYSFLVRLFHPLLHTGLSRRTGYLLYESSRSIEGDLQGHRFLYSAFGLDPEPLSRLIPQPSHLRRFQFLVAP